MNLFEAKSSLMNYMERYLNGEISLESIRDFAWSVIEWFSNDPKARLSVSCDFEKEVWYAIWEIQHLADENHEEEGVTKRTLSEALDYLKNKSKIPENYEGRRP